MFPLTSYEEAKIMISKWCREFFWWFFFDDLLKMNDRPFNKSNFLDFQELDKTINLIYENWGIFNLILNSFEVDLEKNEGIIQLLNSFNNKNFNLIVKDFWLIELLNKSLVDKKIHVSTINWVINYNWILFFQNNFQNIKRVCLERDMNYYYLVETIENILENNNNIELEIIWAAIWCGFSEWSCKLHWISNCHTMETKLLSMTWKSDCSLCALKLLNDKFISQDLLVFLKISSRDRSFEERLGHYNLLNNFINKLKLGTVSNLKEVFEYREKHSNCNIKSCWYY